MGGLHRSGTTALGRILADHPGVSGFQGTGAQEDEGQHLQTVYKPARAYGGPGRFARHGAAHLTETSSPAASVAATELLDRWSPHWDLDRPFLVEKSPPNMLMGRWLQTAFPGSGLIVIVRHPVVVALSTKKWTRRTSLPRLVEHWFAAHDIVERDAQHLRRLLVIRYEDLVRNPGQILDRVAGFVGLDTPLDAGRLQSSRSSRYVDAWSDMARGTVLERSRRLRIQRTYVDRALRYGYNLDDLEAIDPFEWPPIP